MATEHPGVQMRALDVTRDDSIQRCIDSVLADLGGIDLLVNNAGGGHRGTLEQLTLRDMA